MSTVDDACKIRATEPLIEIQTSQSFPPSESYTPNTEATAPSYAGKHYIVDFWGAEHLDDVAMLESALKQAAEVAGAVLLHIHLHRFAQGGGVTGVALLAESHISVHTWPENHFAAFDVFMCGASKPDIAVEYLKKVFKPTRTEVKEILRG